MEQFLRRLTGLLVFAYIAIACTPALAVTLTVTDETGAPLSVPASPNPDYNFDYWWMVEEDTTHPDPDPAQSTNFLTALATGIHASYNPIVATGNSNDLSPLATLDPAKRYYISILPRNSYALGGANIKIGQAAVAVVCENHPLPTAQISVLAFHDNQPINSAPDVPAESGIPGCQVIMFDQAGQQMMDAFGNALGTTYQTNLDGTYILVDGAPVVDVPGNGIYTDANGEAIIKNIYPGKYGVRLIPPGSDWVQTATIEGTPGIDAWVLAGNPPLMGELGFFSWHVFIGFVHPMEFPAPSGTVGSITGQVVVAHTNHPPDPPTLNPGKPVSEAWVGLNNLGGADEQVFAGPADPDTGEFSIPDVPPGTYQLVIWDKPLDVIIDFRTVTVPAGGGVVDLGQIPVFMWFANYEGSVFYDSNGNGYRDPGEVGMPDQALNLRFRDGSIYQATASTPPDGEFAFNEIFPFFKWLVAEVDFARFKATGATFVVDAGGPVTDFNRWINPLNQLSTDPPYVPVGTERTETGVILTQGVMTFGGQTVFADWGKKAYMVGPDNILGTPDDIPGENGGVSGIVFYTVTRAENDPRFAVGEPWEPGVPNVIVNLYKVNNRDVNGLPVIDKVADFVDSTMTDSWDANLPEGCAGDDPRFVDCAETLRTWNQMRPAVFDGGYAFDGLAPGSYVVEVIPPVGYKILRNDDKNVDFGDPVVPSMAALPPPCVGTPYTIPEFLLFDGETENPSYDPANPAATACLCDMKEVRLNAGQNAAADFFLKTDVPKAARFVGLSLNDLAAEINPDSPHAGSNAGVPFMPIAFKDFNGVELGRTLTDEFGYYNILLPGSYTVNAPAPSGVSPNMINIVLNDPGPPASPDPNYNPGYAIFEVTLDAWPGKTTYADTPNLPVTPLVGNGPAECFPSNGAPAISRVDGPGGGPYLASTPANLTITSQGTVVREVPNPACTIDQVEHGLCAATLTVARDNGFGGQIGTVTLNGSPLPVISWSNTTITVGVPSGATTGQLMVARGDTGKETTVGITLHVVSPGYDPAVVRVASIDSIQAAIDSAAPGSLVLVEPGVYLENLIMWKPLELQGYGSGSTVINASAFNTTVTAAWQALMADLITTNAIDLLPGQDPTFALEQGAGITVVANQGDFVQNDNALIDGFSITGGRRGGGVYVNGYASWLEVSNNEIFDNQGNFGGGIRLGIPSLVNGTNDGYVSAGNDHINIHHNRIAGNQGIDGGGGMAIFNGSDNYWVTDCLVCGNFSLLYGGGIAHYGLSDDGWIADNAIAYNFAFDEGGGVMLAGELVPAGAPVGMLTPGSGSVTINSNLILGNMSGDDGGGIRTLNTNGQDVADSPATPANWHEINITNNMVTNNVSADAGGGISLDDTARCNIFNNTLPYNVSTATSVDAFTAVPPPGIGTAISNPQVAGISARVHSTGLQGAFGAGFEQTFSDPVLYNNILWKNQSYHYDDQAVGGPLVLDGFWDLAVFPYDSGEVLDPWYTLLTENPDVATADYSGNGTNLFGTLAADPAFVLERQTDVIAAVAGAVGNLITVTLDAPLPGEFDYHIGDTSSAINTGTNTLPIPGNWMTILDLDIDKDSRPFGGGVDMGADESHGATPAVAPVNVSAIAADGVVNVAQQVDLTWSDANGATDLRYMYVQVGRVVTGGLTKLYYDRVTNKLYLRNDANTAWLGGVAPGSANTVANSKISLDASLTTVTLNGDDLTVSFNLTALTGYSGSHALIMYCADMAGNHTPVWEWLGTWNVVASLANVAPVNVSASAAPGNVNVAQQVNAAWSDANGASDIRYTYLAIGSVASGGLTKVYYNHQTNLLYLLNDTNTAWLGGFAPGSANVIANSKVSIDCSTTTVTPVGNDLSVSFNVTPLTGFTGNKPLDIYVVDNSLAHPPVWQRMGWWVISP